MTKNKLGALALAFAIALGFWMYVVAYVSPEYSKTLYNIPVALEGKGMLTDRQLMLLSEEDYLAFPYGKNVKHGASTVESDLSVLYGY